MTLISSSAVLMDFLLSAVSLSPNTVCMITSLQYLNTDVLSILQNSLDFNGWLPPVIIQLEGSQPSNILPVYHHNAEGQNCCFSLLVLLFPIYIYLHHLTLSCSIVHTCMTECQNFCGISLPFPETVRISRIHMAHAHYFA